MASSAIMLKYIRTKMIMYAIKFTSLPLYRYIPHRCIFLAPYAYETNVSKLEFNPVNIPTANRLIMMLPIPTAATFTGSFKCPINIILIVSSSMKKTEPTDAGID